jgi:flagellar biogenesis protein FliO
MFKEKTESLMMTLIALLAFIILAIYLMTQDAALVGPI